MRSRPLLLNLCMANKVQDHWTWRYEMAQAIARQIDMERFGVKAIYLIGSVKTGNPGPCSDIDLLAHCDDHTEKHQLLRSWCEGWGLCLAYINNCKTGYDSKGSLIDLHIITDNDIKRKTSFAVMPDSYNNSAKLLRKSSSNE